MAGAGKKTFTAGEVLTASDVNTYLMEQSVMYFGGTAARASAIPTPSTGMTSYIGVTGTATIPQLETYTGSAWQTPYGITQVANVSASAATSVAINNIFTSVYDNYKITCIGTSASAGNVASFQIGGNVSSEYKFAEMQVNSGGAAPSNASFSNTNTTGRLGVLSNNNSYFEADFYSPFITGFTSWKSFSNRTDSTLTMYSYFGHVANTASYSSIVISFGNAFTGTIRVYGYRNS